MRDFGASPASGGFDTNLNVGRVAECRDSREFWRLDGVTRVRDESQRGSGRSNLNVGRVASSAPTGFVYTVVSRAANGRFLARASQSFAN